jgi:ribonucleoside-diphosphate reductase beta chain
MNLLRPRPYYKPLEYPWAHELWKKHEAMHWMGYEVPMHEDVRDWNEKLTENEKSLLTQLFRFFTQADIDVAGGYNTRFLPYFSHKPELAMMMNSFAAREAVHIDAYALLLDTVGMPEVTYQQFHEYKEMKDKHEFASDFGTETPLDTLKSLAVYSAFTEGMQLFASFVILLNFSRFNKMKNMGNIIAWSIRDESLHVEGMTTLFKAFAEELVGTNTKTLQEEIKPIALTMLQLEEKFIDLIFSDAGTIKGITADEVKDYIRYITNIRWNQLGFEGNITSVTRNPLPWIDIMINGEEHTNFFEQKSTFYSKAMTQGTFNDIEW